MTDDLLKRLRLQAETSLMRLPFDHVYVSYGEVADRIEELEHIFTVRREAGTRALKMWQDANPGNDLTWPDHADLCVWLMEKVKQAADRIEELEKALARIAKHDLQAVAMDALKPGERIEDKFGETK